MSNDYSTPGEFASIGEMAGSTTAYMADSIALLNGVRRAFDESTDISTGEVKIVGKSVTLRPGHAVLLTLLNVNGVEYEMFLRQTP